MTEELDASDERVIVNLDTMRAAHVVGFGVALYKLTRDGDAVSGRHAGLVETCEQAEAWVGGAEVDAYQVARGTE